jgi:hypothetical protein
MMMTSGEAVKYRSSWHAFTDILKNEGTASLFKGAGANILRAVAGAGAISGYDVLKQFTNNSKFNSCSLERPTLAVVDKRIKLVTLCEQCYLKSTH